MDYLGIDFGTSNCVMAKLKWGKPTVLPLREQNEDGTFREHKVIPSVANFAQDGRTVRCGHQAREAAYLMQGTSVWSVKRNLAEQEPVRVNSRTFKPQSVAYLLFRYLRAGLGNTIIKEPVPVVITVPANSKGMQRESTKRAVNAAGFQVLTLINEPTAAAMAYGLDLEDEKNIMVYDFGGGTFDVTVLRAHHGLLEELSSRGVARLGGDDLDRSLAEELRQRHQLNIPTSSPAMGFLLLEAEKIKKRLSEQEQYTYDINWGEYLHDAKPMQGELTRVELERLFNKEIHKTKNAVESAIKDARIPGGPSLVPQDIDVLLLVGGTTKIPAVASFIQELLGKEAMGGVDPMTCISEGAAIASGILQKAPEVQVQYLIRTEHSMCIELLDISTKKTYLEPVISRGGLIPSEVTKKVNPVQDYQPYAEINVWEGDDYYNLDASENIKLATTSLPINPPRPVTEVDIDITYIYNDDGTVDVSATDSRTNQEVSLRIEYAGSNPDLDQEVGDLDLIGLPTAVVDETNETKKEEVRAKSPSSKEAEEAEHCLHRARLVIEKMASDAEKTQLSNNVAALEEALARGNPEEIKLKTNELWDELIYYMDLFKEGEQKT